MDENNQLLRILLIRTEMIFEKLGCDDYELGKRLINHEEEIKKLKQSGLSRGM